MINCIKRAKALIHEGEPFSVLVMDGKTEIGRVTVRPLTDQKGMYKLIMDVKPLERTEALLRQYGKNRDYYYPKGGSLRYLHGFRLVSQSGPEAAYNQLQNDVSELAEAMPSIDFGIEISKRAKSLQGRTVDEPDAILRYSAPDDIAAGLTAGGFLLDARRTRSNAKDGRMGILMPDVQSGEAVLARIALNDKVRYEEIFRLGNQLTSRGLLRSDGIETRSSDPRPHAFITGSKKEGDFLLANVLQIGKAVGSIRSRDVIAAVRKKKGEALVQFLLRFASAQSEKETLGDILSRAVPVAMAYWLSNYRGFASADPKQAEEFTKSLKSAFGSEGFAMLSELQNLSHRAFHLGQTELELMGKDHDKSDGSRPVTGELTTRQARAEVLTTAGTGYLIRKRDVIFKLRPDSAFISSIYANEGVYGRKFLKLKSKLIEDAHGNTRVVFEGKQEILKMIDRLNSQERHYLHGFFLSDAQKHQAERIVEKESKRGEEGRKGNLIRLRQAQAIVDKDLPGMIRETALADSEVGEIGWNRIQDIVRTYRKIVATMLIFARANKAISEEQFKDWTGKSYRWYPLSIASPGQKRSLDVNPFAHSDLLNTNTRGKEFVNMREAIMDSVYSIWTSVSYFTAQAEILSPEHIGVDNPYRKDILFGEQPSNLMADQPDFHDDSHYLWFRYLETNEHGERFVYARVTKYSQMGRALEAMRNVQEKSLGMKGAKLARNTFSWWIMSDPNLLFGSWVGEMFYSMAFYNHHTERKANAEPSLADYIPAWMPFIGDLFKSLLPFALPLLSVAKKGNMSAKVSWQAFAKNYPQYAANLENSRFYSLNPYADTRQIRNFLEAFGPLGVALYSNLTRLQKLSAQISIEIKGDGATARTTRFFLQALMDTLTLIARMPNFQRFVGFQAHRLEIEKLGKQLDFREESMVVANAQARFEEEGSHAIVELPNALIPFLKGEISSNFGSIRKAFGHGPKRMKLLNLYNVGTLGVAAGFAGFILGYLIFSGDNEDEDRPISGKQTLKTRPEDITTATASRFHLSSWADGSDQVVLRKPWLLGSFFDVFTHMFDWIFTGGKVFSNGAKLYDKSMVHAVLPHDLPFTSGDYLATEHRHIFGRVKDLEKDYPLVPSFVWTQMGFFSQAILDTMAIMKSEADVSDYPSIRPLFISWQGLLSPLHKTMGLQSDARARMDAILADSKLGDVYEKRVQDIDLADVSKELKSGVYSLIAVGLNRGTGTNEGMLTYGGSRKDGDGAVFDFLTDTVLLNEQFRGDLSEGDVIAIWKKVRTVTRANEEALWFSRPIWKEEFRDFAKISEPDIVRPLFDKEMHGLAGRKWNSHAGQVTVPDGFNGYNALYENFVSLHKQRRADPENGEINEKYEEAEAELRGVTELAIVQLRKVETNIARELLKILAENETKTDSQGR